MKSQHSLNSWRKKKRDSKTHFFFFFCQFYSWDFNLLQCRLSKISLIRVPITSNYPDKTRLDHEASIASLLLATNLLSHLILWSDSTVSPAFMKPQTPFLSIWQESFLQPFVYYKFTCTCFATAGGRSGRNEVRSQATDSSALLWIREYLSPRVSPCPYSLQTRLDLNLELPARGHISQRTMQGTNKTNTGLRPHSMKKPELEPRGGKQARSCPQPLFLGSLPGALIAADAAALGIPTLGTFHFALSSDHKCGWDLGKQYHLSLESSIARIISILRWCLFWGACQEFTWVIFTARLCCKAKQPEIQEVQWEASWPLTMGRNSAHREAGHLASLPWHTVVAPSGVSLGAPGVFGYFSLLRPQAHIYLLERGRKSRTHRAKRNSNGQSPAARRGFGA